MLTVAEIRALYPNPMSDNAVQHSNQQYDPKYRHQCTYCVGGAIMLAYVFPNGDARPGDDCWPTSDELADFLHEINPTLSEQSAYYLADMIITTNDKEEFELAWGYVAEALTNYNHS